MKTENGQQFISNVAASCHSEPLFSSVLLLPQVAGLLSVHVIREGRWQRGKLRKNGRSLWLLCINIQDLRK